MSGTNPTGARRYTLNKVVGTGAYGVVISVNDSISGRSLAIKKIPNAFDDLTDSKVRGARAYKANMRAHATAYPARALAIATPQA